jgi:hypothetical protein
VRIVAIRWRAPSPIKANLTPEHTLVFGLDLPESAYRQLPPLLARRSAPPAGVGLSNGVPKRHPADQRLMKLRMSKMIFVNLPVTDLKRSMAFFAAVGAVNNPQFTDDTAACMAVSGTIHVMLLTHDNGGSSRQSRSSMRTSRRR